MAHSSPLSKQAIPAETFQPLDVALVSMPFGALTKPSLALSLLKAELSPLQVRTSVFYFTIRLAEMIGGCRYVQLAGGIPISFDLLGEWLFAGALFGEEGLDVQGYVDDVLLAQLINHLPPPYSAGTLRLDRFSPNFQHAEELGYANVRPYPAYFYIYYPLSEEAIANLAYYFTFSYREPQPVAEYTATLWQEIKAWKKDYAESDLFFIDKETCLLIWDLRPGATLPVIIVSGLRRALYLACDSAQNLTSLHEIARAQSNVPVERSQVEAFLQSLVDSRLMLRDGNRYLSLAIPVGQGYTPSIPVLQRMEATIIRHGTRVNDRIVLSVNHGLEIMPMP